ncbi:MAG TPA: PEP-CTERM sorting domain-containing protein [Tepidisphaeraceae bacterium]|nr:PEP-CTERM sorting domain-containing protein [Tepidisphaeraceae bacterium]
MNRSSRFAIQSVVALSLLNAQQLLAQNFSISLGVREISNQTATIGSDGGLFGTMEWVGFSGQTLPIDGAWHDFSWTFGTDAVTAFTGNGVLDGVRGTLEHIRLVNTGGTSSVVNLWVDQIEAVNSENSQTTLIANGFEGYANGVQAVFRQPSLSGTTSDNVSATSSAGVAGDAAAVGVRSEKMSFNFIDNDPTRWVRISSFNTANAPNPVIPLASGSIVRFKLRAMFPVNTSAWNSDSSGNYSDVSKWDLPPNTLTPPGVNTGASNTDIATFKNVLTQSRTVTVDSPLILNKLILQSTFGYNFVQAGSNDILLKAPSGLKPEFIVSAGVNSINVPITSSASMNWIIDGANTKLTLVRGFTVTNPEAIDINKTGLGTAETKSFKADVLNIAGGTVRVSADSVGAVDLNVLTISGTTPSSKFDITDNGVVLNYTTDSPLVRTGDLIKFGYATGNWSGNGITSTTAAANSELGIGYGEASVIGATTEFMGATTDATAVLIRTTLKGDTNLNGVVDFNDLLKVAQNYGTVTGKRWTEGDSNYDGLTDFNDLLALAQNYDQSLTLSESDWLDDTFGSDFTSDWSTALAMVPEPGTLGLLGFGLIWLRLDRRVARS